MAKVIKKADGPSVAKLDWTEVKGSEIEEAEVCYSAVDELSL